MAAITEYTSTEAVRAALGVTDNEVLDEFLLDQNLDFALIRDLDDWYPDRSALTEAEERGLRLYSMWFCAAEVAWMWMAYPQRISDGKTDMRRFTSLDLEKLAKHAEDKRDALKEELDPAPAAVSIGTYFAAASPDYDPVTNEET